MISTSGLRDLFEEFYPDEPYQSVEQEIAAVMEGSKNVAHYIVHFDEISDGEYSSLLKRCLADDLIITHQLIDDIRNPKGDEQAELFICRQSESWRVPAHRALMSVLRDGYPWSDGLEALHSKLLGYDKAQIKSWIVARRRQHVSWSGLTVYLLLTRQQRARLDRFGRRCLDPDTDEEFLVIYPIHHLAPKRVLELPADTTFARTSIDRKTFDQIFPTINDAGANEVFASVISQEMIITMNRGLRSSVEVFDGTDWA